MPKFEDSFLALPFCPPLCFIISFVLAALACHWLERPSN